MSAEHLLNDDLPNTSSVVPAAKQDKPTYYDLMMLRLEAGARLARSLKTLRDANVLNVDEGAAPASTQAMEIAEQHWADICMGVVPVIDTVGTYRMRDDLPACVEAFRIIVMEHAQREALERECRNLVAHDDGFKLLTRPQLLYIEPKHTCDGTCNHDSKTI